MNGTLKGFHHEHTSWNGRRGEDLFVRLDPGEEIHASFASIGRRGWV